jgi:serine O-acetyltransferase
MLKNVKLRQIAKELESLDVSHRVKLPDLDLSFECLNSLVSVVITTHSDIEDRLAGVSRTAELTELLLGQVLQGPKARSIATKLIKLLPKIKQAIILDAKFTHASDPAATSVEEVLISYPGLRAIATHRISNVLYKFGVPIIPRLFSEFAHGATGIDIHPGASIGEEFCIDHGTGIVIGETTKIGNRVKIYQGVTLGALSVSKQSASKKRHPTVEDDAVIYANATILGGRTIIGKGSIIGGNVWLTHSVPPNSKVYVEEAPTVK